MTLQPYGAEKLDQLALQWLDLAAMARSMASTCQENQIDDLVLHDKKANEWLQNLKRWTLRAQVELEIRIADAKADQNATAREKE